MPKSFQFLLLFIALPISSVFAQTLTQPTFQLAETMFKSQKYEQAAAYYSKLYSDRGLLTNHQQQALYIHWGGCLYVLGKNDSALLISRQLLKMANPLPVHLYDSYQREGIIAIEKGQLKNGMASLKKAQELNVKHKLNLLKAELSLAFLYLQKGNLGQSLRYNLQVYQIAQQNKDTLYLSIAITNIAGIYEMKGSLDKAKKEYLNAIRLKKQANLVRGMAQCYQGVTMIAYKNKEYQQGIDYTLKEIELDLQEGDDYNLTYAYYNLAIGYKELKQYDKTQYYLELSRQKMLKSFDTIDLVNLYVSLSELQIDIAEYTKAQKLIEEALSLASKYQLKKDEQRLQLLLVKVYKHQSNYTMAFNTLEKYLTLKDSLQNIDKERISQELIKKYELSEKQKEIAQQKLKLAEQQNKNHFLLLSFLSVALICVILVGLVLYNKMKYRQKLDIAFETINQEISTMKNQFEYQNIGIRISKSLTNRQTLSQVNRVISSLTDFEEQMIQRLKSSTSFNYLVSHELRRNLQQIQENLSEINKNVMPVEKASLQTSIEKVRGLDTLVQSLLSLAELENKPICQSICNFNDLWRDLQDELPVPTHCEIYVEALPTLKADVLLMKQVFLNLINNALKFSSQNSLIKVKIKATIDSVVRIEVSDNGVGFDENLKEQLFKPFHRLQDQFEGTGVGLIVVKTIIEKHNGEVYAHNNIDGGATFGFLLPISTIV